MDSKGWDERYAATPGLVWTGDPNRFVAEELDGLPPGRALDLAAGEGRHAIWLAGKGWDVTAVDFSAVAVERGRRIAAERGLAVNWAVADLARYVPPSAAFDAVLIAYLHLPASVRAGVLARAAAALAPGGTVLVVGHDRTNLAGGVGGPQDPAVLYTPETIVAELGGLRPRRAETAQREVDVDGVVVRALDTVVVAVRPGGGGWPSKVLTAG